MGEAVTTLPLPHDLMACADKTVVIMSMYSYCMFIYLRRASWHSSATLTHVSPWFFLGCKANARVKPAKTGHGPHSSSFCVVLCILFCVVLCIVCV